MYPGSSSTNDDSGESDDLAIEHDLDCYLKSTDPGLQKAAAECLRRRIQKSLSSVKPSKPLCSHYEALKLQFDQVLDADVKKLLADIISALAFRIPAAGESLTYKLLGSQGDIGTWGHEYVRNLAAEFFQHCSSKWGFYMDSEEYEMAIPIPEEGTKLAYLVNEIAAFHMEHNAEPEAVDILMKIDNLEEINKLINKANYKPTCLYLIHSTKYLICPVDDIEALKIAYSNYLKFKEYSRALVIALYLGKMKLVKEVFTSCDAILSKKQLCFIIGRHGTGTPFELVNQLSAEDEELKNIIINANLSEHYLALDNELSPKSPDIFKSAGPIVDSAREILGATFENAFVNAGFCQDKLMIVPSESSSSGNRTYLNTDHWLFKYRDDAKISAAASLGLIFLWKVDDGIDLFQYFSSTDTSILSGALLGHGIMNCNIKCHDALSLLGDYCTFPDPSIRIAAVMGLGLAYAGQPNHEVKHVLTRVLQSSEAPLDERAFAAISLGLVYIGSQDQNVSSDINLTFWDLTDVDVETPFARLMILGDGLLNLGKKNNRYNSFELLHHKDKLKKCAYATLLSCVFAGTRDKHLVKQKVQDLLGHCKRDLEKGETYQGPAVLGIAMIAMAEDKSQEKVIVSLEKLLEDGEPNIRRAVPLALALLCVSNPKMNVVNTLRGLTHDPDTKVAMAAIIALGLIGAGTNNEIIDAMLCKLSSYYDKETDVLYCVRVARGLVHLGKGLLTLTPRHSEQFLLSPVAMSGLVIFVHACLDMDAFMLGKYHYVLYFLVLAMQPRMLMALDENLQPLSVPVRVGEAVDADQEGRPKSISGCQDHCTPVLLAAGQRAELASEKHLPLSPFLEGFVIMKKNPDYREGST